MLQYVSHEWAHAYRFYGNSRNEERAHRPPLTLDVEQMARNVNDEFAQHEATSHFVATALNNTRHVLLIDSIDVFYGMPSVARRSFDILFPHANKTTSSKHANDTLLQDDYDFAADRQRRLTLLHERVRNVDDVLKRLQTTKWAKYDIHRRIYYEQIHSMGVFM